MYINFENEFYIWTCQEGYLLVNVTFKKFKPWMSRINKKHNLKKKGKNKIKMNKK
jgi:hypothetical protein